MSNVEVGDKVQICGWVMRNDSENTFLIRHDKKVNVELLEKKFQKGDIVVCDNKGRVGQIEDVDRHQSYLLQVDDGMQWLDCFSGLRRATEKEKSEFRLKMQEKQDRIDAAEFEALTSRMSARQIFKSFKGMLETATNKVRDEPKIDAEETKDEKDDQQPAPAVPTVATKVEKKPIFDEKKGRFQCSCCGGWRTSYWSLQKRGADDAATNFVECYSCKATSEY